MHGSQGRPQSIEITVVAHGGIRGHCSRCRRPAPGYDRLPQRRWLFVPLWGIPTWFCYAPRRQPQMPISSLCYFIGLVEQVQQVEVPESYWQHVPVPSRST